MAVNEVATGTQTATIGVEHTLDTETVANAYQVYVDLINMASGDTVELRAYHMVHSAGTARQIYSQTMSGAQADLIFASVPIASANHIHFTLKQTAGTGRSFAWSVITLA